MSDTGLMIVKIGGSDGIRMAEVGQEVASWAKAKRPVIIVHGASARTNQLCRERGIQPEFLLSPSGHSSRYTTRKIRDIFVEAAKAINEEITNAIEHQGVGVQGMAAERGCLQGRRKRAIRALVNGKQIVVRDDYSGLITGVDVGQIERCIEAGRIPVVPPLAFSERDGFLNVDGDRAAAAIAARLAAERLVILSNVPGLYRDYPDPASMVTQLRSSELDRAMSWAEGRMKRKLLSVRKSIQSGVKEVVLADGRIARPLRQALSGGGTRIHA